MDWNEIFNLLRCKVEGVLEAVSGFTNLFSSSFENNEPVFFVFWCSCIAKGLIKADDIARRAVADLMTHFYLKICLSQPHLMLR